MARCIELKETGGARSEALPAGDEIVFRDTPKCIILEESYGALINRYEAGVNDDDILGFSTHVCSHLEVYCPVVIEKTRDHDKASFYPLQQPPRP